MKSTWLSRIMPILRGPGLRAIVSRGISLVATFGMTVTIARTMPDKETAGLVYLVNTLMIVAATFGRIGTDNLALREVAKDGERTGWILRHAARTIFIVSPPTMLLLTIAVWLQSGITHGILLGFVASMAIIPLGMSVLAGAALRGAGRIAAGTLAELGSTPALASLGMVIASISHVQSVIVHVGLISLGYMATTLWSWWLLARTIPDVRKKATDYRSFLETYRGSLFSFFTASLGFLLFTWLPVIMLGYFSTTEEVADFNSAARVAAFVSLIPTIQISYLSQQFARLHHLNKIDQVNKIARTATWQAMVSAGALTAPLVLFPETVLHLFGDAYREAAPVLQATALGTFLVAAIGPVHGLMLTVGQERTAGRLTTVLVVVSAILLPMLAPQGAFAVTIASQSIALAYAVSCAIVLARNGIFTIIRPPHAHNR